LAGFDENDYVMHSNANNRSYQVLVEEFVVLRKSTLLLYQSFEEENLLNQGLASGNFMSVRALGYITSGHLLHHLHVIKNRYL